MKTHRILRFCSIAVISLLLPVVAAAATDAQRASFNVTVRAVDDAGQPVAGADIGFAWGLMGGAAPDSGDTRAPADASGRAIFSGRTIFDRFAYGARQTGYYPVLGVVAAHERVQNGEWQPANQVVTVALKRVKNPVPMSAKLIATELPAHDAWVGFDVEKGDWVPPYGTGAKADLEFRSEPSVRDDLNYTGTLSIRFLGESNGLAPFDIPANDHSEFRSPYAAPLDGYVASWQWHTGRTTAAGAQSTFVDESNPNRAFLYRVRSVTTDGHVVRAFYGKIYGPVAYDPRSAHGHGFVTFTLYFNPDGTTNLEFDPARNLVRGQPGLKP